MEAKILEVLKEVKPDIDYLNEANLIGEDLLDSLAIVQVVVALESEFNIDMDPDDILPENFKTLNDIVSLVKKCKGE